MDVIIRRAEKHDVAGIKAIYAQPHAYEGTLQLPYPSDAMWMARFEAQTTEHHNLVAVANNQVVGQLSLMTSPKPRLKHVASIAMAVCGSATRQGIGSMLLNAALDMSDNWLNIQRVELQVYADNHAAIGLYSKCGFVQEGLHKRAAFKAGQYADLISMARLTSPA